MADYKIDRYLKTTNNSLKAWSAADEFIIQYVGDEKLTDKKTKIYNDRFGYLNLNLNSDQKNIIIDYKSQYKSHTRNLRANGFKGNESDFTNVLENEDVNIDLALMHIPKSIELFHFYVQHIYNNINKDGSVVCGFMTRHFSKQIVEIANKYFNDVQQSKAWKKSRLLILKDPKVNIENELSFINKIEVAEDEYLEQYYGVFASSGIDIATRFLMEKIQISNSESKVLDLASGNGIIAYDLNKKIPNAEFHLLDDFYLAIESSKLNLKGDNIYFHYDDSLFNFEDEEFDLIVSNPPFHFEYEIDVSISIDLFKQVIRVLKSNGSFQIVANRHLNYKVHLEKIFTTVEVIAENEKFVVYKSTK